LTVPMDSPMTSKTPPVQSKISPTLSSKIRKLLG
jgi:hypothetical protein